MAITPEKAAEVTEPDKRKIKILEEAVDEAILARCTSTRPEICLDAEMFGRYSTKIFERMKELYEQAGWNVKYESDQRDGDYVRLTPKKTGFAGGYR